MVKGEAPEPYKNPALFLTNTHPTRGLKDLIKAVVGRLTGADNQLGSILRLDTSYGSGKTHALIGLNHILTAPEQIPNLAEFVDPAVLPGQPVTVAIFDGENADPMNGRRMEGDILAYNALGGVGRAVGGAGPVMGASATVTGWVCRLPEQKPYGNSWTSCPSIWASSGVLPLAGLLSNSPPSSPIWSRR